MTFGRKTYERPARVFPQPVPAGQQRGTYAAPGLALAVPKPEAHRNAHLLSMARGRPCLFRINGVCNFDAATTVACHSNLGAHGKAGARKADDEYTAWGCFACHAWLDQGCADGTRKELAFMSAHLAQVCEWRAIAGSAAAHPKDRAAAQWALDHLNATPLPDRKQSEEAGGLECDTTRAVRPRAAAMFDGSHLVPIVAFDIDSPGEPSIPASPSIQGAPA